MDGGCLIVNSQKYSGNVFTLWKSLYYFNCFGVNLRLFFIPGLTHNFLLGNVGRGNGENPIEEIMTRVVLISIRLENGSQSVLCEGPV